MNVRTFTFTSFLLLAVTIAALSGCERINQVVQPDAVTPSTEATLKIGVIQSSHSLHDF